MPYTNAAGMTDTQREYRRYLSSARWRKVRAIRRMIDGQKCCVCGSKKGLEVHHKSYRNRGNMGVFGIMAEVADCVTLCHKCHQREHKSR